MSLHVQSCIWPKKDKNSDYFSRKKHFLSIVKYNELLFNIYLVTRLIQIEVKYNLATGITIQAWLIILRSRVNTDTGTMIEKYGKKAKKNLML